MKMIKYKYYSTIMEDHLTELLRTALTTYNPDFKKTYKKKKCIRNKLDYNYK